MDISPTILEAAKNVRGIVFDVDGVLTDGRIIYTDDGHEHKQFNVQDGASIKLLQQHNIVVAIITGRRSPMVARRARELGIAFIEQGADSKATALSKLISAGFPNSGNAAVGDDLQDIDVFNHDAVSLAISVPNAHPATLGHADIVTTRRGGEGVAVEIAQMLLTAQGKWTY